MNKTLGMKHLAGAKNGCEVSKAGRLDQLFSPDRNAEDLFLKLAPLMSCFCSW
jgi:hypothetical protein